MAAARSIGSVTLLLASVAVPAKIFTAQSEKKVSFNRLVKATGNRTKTQTIDEISGVLVTWDDLVNGYEHTPGQFVVFSADELKALELEGDPDTIRLREIVPISSVDSRHVGKAMYLGPDKGALRSFAFLAKLLGDRSLAAIGQRGGRTRDDLVLVRAQDHALVMHEMLYADEVRSVAETVAPAEFTFSAKEMELGEKLVKALGMPAFMAARFVDRGAERVKAAVEKRIAGKQIVIPAAPSAAGAPLDLVGQLELSIRPGRGPKKARAPESQVQSRRKRATG